MRAVVPLLLPWIAAVLLALADGRRRAVAWLGAAALGATLLALLALAAAVVDGGPVEVVAGAWPAGVGIALRADTLSVLFALVSVAVLLAALLHEVLQGVHERTLPALFLFLAAGLTGLFLTADAFNFYVFFEVSMTASFVLASYGQREREVRAALIFTVVNLLGSMIFVTAVAGLYRMTGTLDMRAMARAVAAREPGDLLVVAVLLFVAFSLKLGLFPFHFWLPPIYRDAWPSVAAVLSGAVANIGAYGFIRFGGAVLPDAVRATAPLLVALAAASLLYGALQAVSVRSAGEMLAYSAIGQAGYILLAVALGGRAGLTAAIVYALLNALNKGLLFLATGLRGPLVGAAFVVGALSVAGLPPAAGFFGKASLFRAAMAADSAAVVALVALGGSLSLVYMFQTYQRVFWARDRQGATSASPAGARAIAAVLAAAVLALGAWPQPLLALSARAADHVLDGAAGRLAAGR